MNILARPPYSPPQAPVGYSPTWERTQLASVARSIPFQVTRTIRAASVVEATDNTILADTTAGSFSLTLPLANQVQFLDVTIKNIGSGVLSIVGTVDGLTDVTVPPQSILRIQSDGTSWQCLLGFEGLGVIYVRAFGAFADGIHDDTAAVNRALAAIPAGGDVTLFFPPTILVSSVLTVPRPNVTFDAAPGSVITWSAFGTVTRAFGFLATMQCGIQADVNNFRITENLKLVGPHTGTYVGNDAVIASVGLSSAARRQRLTVDCEMTGSGSYGLYAQWVDFVECTTLYAHNIGHAGAMFFSCNHGRIRQQVRVETITPGTAGNMYGISLTLDSTNYSIDPHAGTPLAANPFCNDWVIDGVCVEDVAWEGIDGHGGYNVTVCHCRVFNTKLGISVASGSGSASAYAGWQNKVLDNVIDGRKSDATASGRENTGYAINVNGGATLLHRNVLVRGNTIIAKGVKDQYATGVINAQYCDSPDIADNTFELWGGAAIVVEVSDNWHVNDNTFKNVVPSDTIGRCIVNTQAAAPRGVVTGNLVNPNGGTAPLTGIYITALTSRLYLSDNDFSACTTAAGAFSTSPPKTQGGRGWPTVLEITGTPSTIDVSTMAGGEDIVLYLNSGSPYTIDYITNATLCQCVTLVNVGSANVTLSRVSSVLNASTAAVLTPLATVRVLQGPTYWHEVCRSIPNG